MDAVTHSIDLRLALSEPPTTRRAQGQGHAPWCTQHTARGCLGEELTLPDSRVTVWLVRTQGGEDHVVLDYPGGNLEIVLPR